MKIMLGSRVYTKEVFGNFGLASPGGRVLLVQTPVPVIVVVSWFLGKLCEASFVCIFSEFFYLNSFI